LIVYKFFIIIYIWYNFKQVLNILKRNMVIKDQASILTAGVRCKFCLSERVVKNGLRKNTQYWLCKSCGRGFVNNQALPGMRYPVETVAKAVGEYYGGSSLNAVCQDIGGSAGDLPSSSVVHAWIKKMTQKGLTEAQKFQPLVSDRWIASITSIWLNHSMYLYINILDSETQFLIASRLGKFKDIKTVFETAKQKTAKNPVCILTDGWRGYSDVIEQVFGADTTHLVIRPSISEEVSKEYLAFLKHWRRMFKIKFKLIRSLDENIQSMVDGLAFGYNFFSPQVNLQQKTPAEAAYIKFPYSSWLEVSRVN
jgi:transposase-like protein